MRLMERLRGVEGEVERNGEIGERMREEMEGMREEMERREKQHEEELVKVIQ